jgi:tetratricopeptide (TPR) repeat protein
MRGRYAGIFILGVVGLCLLGGVAYNLPPVHERLAWRVDTLRVQVKRFFNPPEEAVFTPQQQRIPARGQEGVAVTPQPTPTPFPAATVTASPTGTPLPSPTPGPTPTPIPEYAALSGIRHEYQQFNNCAPANLAMLLSYWGWPGDQFETRAYLRPNYEVDDKNVNPFEIVDFVEKNTGFQALWRVGGDPVLLKRLVAAGFPVLIEKGLHPSHDAWLGHYQTISGYDDARGQFLVYDSFEGPPEAYGVPYEVIAQFWRHFNFVYVVVFPAERAAEVDAILGQAGDPRMNYQMAADLALQETGTLGGREQFFAWFNRGSNLVYLEDYAGAAQAFDTAFALYAALPEEERPWRLMWYRDGPYAAYYHSGRYQDVINLANTTMGSVDKAVLEETYFWRGLARAALGDRDGAVNDLRRAYALNPNSTPAGEELRRLGETVP